MKSLSNQIEHYKLEIEALKKLAEEITAQWNGEDEAGEDYAHIADEIIEKIKELQDLLNELIRN